MSTFIVPKRDDETQEEYTARVKQLLEVAYLPGVAFRMPARGTLTDYHVAVIALLEEMRPVGADMGTIMCALAIKWLKNAAPRTLWQRIRWVFGCMIRIWRRS